jgi:hypothetical protein
LSGVIVAWPVCTLARRRSISLQLGLLHPQGDQSVTPGWWTASTNFYLTLRITLLLLSRPRGNSARQSIRYG